MNNSVNKYVQIDFLSFLKNISPIKMARNSLMKIVFPINILKVNINHQEINDKIAYNTANNTLLSTKVIQFNRFLNIEYYNIIQSTLIASNMPSVMERLIEIKNRKRRYNKITPDVQQPKQFQLNKLVKSDGISINRASDLLGIPRSTGKAVMKKINELEQLCTVYSNSLNRAIENYNGQMNNYKAQIEFIHQVRQNPYVITLPTFSCNIYYPFMICIFNQYY